MLMTTRKQLNDVYPLWFDGYGIFSTLQSKNIPWKDDLIYTSLDREYHGNISGEKYISPLVDKICVGNFLTATEKNTIATVIESIYIENWVKQWETKYFQYNPIENYSMVEKMSDDKTVTEYGKKHIRTDDLTHARTGSDTETPDLTNTQQNDINGFNSPTAVPTGGQTSKTNGNSRTEYDTQEKDSGTQTDVDSGNDSTTRNYNLTRSGNIGVTTSQQMIQSERELWLWEYFHNVVFPDLDKILTIPIY